MESFVIGPRPRFVKLHDAEALEFSALKGLAQPERKERSLKEPPFAAIF